MDSVKIDRAVEMMHGGAREKVDAAGLAADALRHGEQRGDRDHDEHVVEAAVREFNKFFLGVLHTRRIHVD